MWRFLIILELFLLLLEKMKTNEEKCIMEKKTENSCFGSGCDDSTAHLYDSLL